MGTELLTSHGGQHGKTAAPGKKPPSGGRVQGRPEVGPSPTGQGWMSGRPFPPPIRQRRSGRHFSAPDESGDARVITLLGKVAGTVRDHDPRGAFLPVRRANYLFFPVPAHSSRHPCMSRGGSSPHTDRSVTSHYVRSTRARMRMGRKSKHYGGFVGILSLAIRDDVLGRGH